MSVWALAFVCAQGLCACGWCVRVHVVMALTDVQVTICDIGVFVSVCVCLPLCAQVGCVRVDGLCVCVK